MARSLKFADLQLCFRVGKNLVHDMAHSRLTELSVTLFSVTPNEYEPPGFMAAENDNFAFGDEPTTLNVGEVATVSIIKTFLKCYNYRFYMKKKCILFFSFIFSDCFQPAYALACLHVECS